MGELISLGDWMSARTGALPERAGSLPCATEAVSAHAEAVSAHAEAVSAHAEAVSASLGAVQFIYDLSCPLSYLAAEQVEHSLGDVEWIPALYGVSDPVAVRAEAARRARALRLPLVWPDRYPEPLPRASRAAAHASTAGFGARFALAALRLAFCGGFDLDDSAVLAEAAAAAGIGVRECLEAADNPALDARVRGDALLGVSRLPAIRIGRHVFDGDQAIPEATALLHVLTSVPAAETSSPPLAPPA